MNRPLLDRIANADLYEGYILYPYRPSVKNRQRWTFGGLYPEAYCRREGGTDVPSNQTECLVQGSQDTIVEVTVRCLHLPERIVGQFTPPLWGWTDSPEPPFQPVETLRLGDQDFHSWQEAEERRIELTDVHLGDILKRQERHQIFTFPGSRWLEPLPDQREAISGVSCADSRLLEAAVEMKATRVAEGLYKMTVRVVNRTPLNDLGDTSRDEVLLHSLISTHTILGVRQGEYVSLLDPPESWRETAADCHNVGTWPVLVGEEGSAGHPAVVTDHSLRLSASGSREPGRSVRRDRD